MNLIILPGHHKQLRLLKGKTDLLSVSPALYAAKYSVEAGCRECFLTRAEGDRNGDVVSVSPGAGDKVQQVVDVDIPQEHPKHASLL